MNTDIDHRDLAPAPSPLSPKNQQSPRRQQVGTKRASFTFSSKQQIDDTAMLQQQQKALKRARLSHPQDGLMFSMMNEDPKGTAGPPYPGGTLASAPVGAMFSHHSLLAASQLSRLQQLQLQTNPFLLNPALLAATATANAVGFTSNGATAAAQQLMMAQAFASGANPVVQQQINSLIAAELNRMAAVDQEVAGTGLNSSHIIGSESGLRSDSSNVACLNLGSDFLPIIGQQTRLCDCGMSLCHEIGYPHRGSVPFPVSNPDLVEQWCEVLDISNPERRQQIHACPEHFQVAFWHFHQDHQTLNMATGQIMPLEDPSVLPDAHLQSFVDACKQGRADERGPSIRMMELHRYWSQVRRPPTLEP